MSWVIAADKKTPRTSRGVRCSGIPVSSGSLWNGRLLAVYQWNCSSSVEPVSAVTEDEPPWITVVMSSK